MNAVGAADVIIVFAISALHPGMFCSLSPSPLKPSGWLIPGYSLGLSMSAVSYEKPSLTPAWRTTLWSVWIPYPQCCMAFFKHIDH